MQITVPDMWMVRVTHTTQAGPTRGAIERYTGVNLDPDDTTPGAHPLWFEQGVLTRDAASGAWMSSRTRVEARRDDDASAVASAMYDAARGFLELGLEPLKRPTSVTAPDQLRIEIGDFTWQFSSDSAPEAAWRILAAARRMHEAVPTEPIIR